MTINLEDNRTGSFSSPKTSFIITKRCGRAAEETRRDSHLLLLPPLLARLARGAPPSGGRRRLDTLTRSLGLELLCKLFTPVQSSILGGHGTPLGAPARRVGPLSLFDELLVVRTLRNNTQGALCCQCREAIMFGQTLPCRDCVCVCVCVCVFAHVLALSSKH